MDAIELTSLSGQALVLIAFAAGLLSTSVGAGGGLLLVGLATFLPAQTVIPTHAAIMLVGSLSGWILLRKSTDRSIVMPFVFGAIVGLVLAVPLLGRLAPETMTIVLAAFLLLTTWLSLPTAIAQNRNYPWLCGTVSSFMAVFVGATRPILLTMLSSRIHDHKIVVSSVNACATLQHVGKIAVFALVGVMVIENVQVLAVLCSATMIGNWCGKKLLIGSAENTIKMMTKLVVTGLACHLIWQSVDLDLVGGVGKTEFISVQLYDRD